MIIRTSSSVVAAQTVLLLEVHLAVLSTSQPGREFVVSEFERDQASHFTLTIFPPSEEPQVSQTERLLGSHFNGFYKRSVLSFQEVFVPIRERRRDELFLRMRYYYPQDLTLLKSNEMFPFEICNNESVAHAGSRAQLSMVTSHGKVVNDWSWVVSEEQLAHFSKDGNLQAREILESLAVWEQPLRQFSREAFEKKQISWRQGWLGDGRACTEVAFESKEHGTQLAMFVYKLYEQIQSRASDEKQRQKRQMMVTGRVLDIGASDGRTGPLWNVLADMQVAGLFVEGNTKNCERSDLDPEWHEMLCGVLALPPDMERLLRDSRMFREASRQSKLPPIDIVKIDIDTFDCDVALAILQSVEHVGILIMEVNPTPPPVAYAFHFYEEHPENLNRAFDMWPLHGCSLSYQVQLFAAFDLLLYRYTGHDAIYLHKDFWDLLQDRPNHANTGMDEFACYEATASLVNTYDIPLSYTQDWFFAASPLEALSRVAGNYSELIESRMLGNTMPKLGRWPFSLELATGHPFR